MKITGHLPNWKILQTDSEIVLIAGNTKTLLDKWGIGLNLSVPYKHAQNGLIERHIGMLYDVARTMMLQSKAPPSLFEDCLKYAKTILNECRVPYDMGITPYEAFTGKRPTMENKLEFYKKGASHVSKEERKGKGKLVDKSNIIRYIGYAPDYEDGFYVYNPKDKSVKVRRDIHWFTENYTANQAKTKSSKSSDPRIPRNVREALEGPDKEKWLEAIHKELKACFDRGTFRRR
jgi:hypothetical protein